LADFSIPEEVSPSEIVIPIEGDPAEAESRANDIRKRFTAGEAFASLASQYSKGPTAGKGGTIGTYITLKLNPEIATGDGIALAYHAGAELMDMEFYQFHPTALVQFKQFEDIVALPQFLISEAVRGEGGVLLNNRGERFMEKYHVKMELAPRDVVSRAIVEEMKATGEDHVFLSLKNMDSRSE
jgi:hypothetical protein